MPGMFSPGFRGGVAFLATTPKIFVLDPSNPIWGKSGWWEEQFDAPFDPLGPSWPYGYFRLPYLGGAWPGAN